MQKNCQHEAVLKLFVDNIFLIMKLDIDYTRIRHREWPI